MAYDPTPNREALREAAFVTARLAGKTVIEAGAAAGLKRSQAFVLESRPTVRDAIRVATAEQIAEAGACAADAAREAVETMVVLMRNARSEAVKLRACEALLSYTSAAQGAAETEATLAQLQAEVDRLTLPLASA
jgi:hypothetical protein